MGAKGKATTLFHRIRRPLVGRVLYVKDQILGKDKMISAVAIINIAH
jgi:hypothetical protein